MRTLILASLLIAVLGCRTEPTMPAGGDFPTRQTYNVPAKTLLEKVRSIVGLPIESEQEGRLVTGWEDHTGARFGVAGIARTWQERTRYTIAVTPAWDDPQGRSTIEVTEESQQRPHANYEWGSQQAIKRPERAAIMAKKIDTALAAAAK